MGTFPLLDGPIDWICNMVWEAVAFFLDSSLGYQQLESMDNLLFMNDGVYADFWTLVSKAYDMVVPFGFAFITTYFLIHMFDIASKEQMSVESIGRAMIGLVITVAIAGNLTTIINTSLSIGESLSAKAQSVLMTDFEDQTNDVIAELQEENPGARVLGVFVESLIVWLIHQIAIIVIDLAFCQRMLELGWRAALAPIGIANAFDGGANSSAVRYLKSFLAVAVSGVAIYLVAVLGLKLSIGLFTSDLAGNMWLSAAALLGAGITAMAAATKTKEIVGA